jgi:hypothetical protein
MADRADASAQRANTDAERADAASDRPALSGYLGIYDADGGVIGEVSYVVGHFLGRAECALCDITHTWRRKPEWDAMAARLGVPFVLRHRNEVDDEVRDVIAGIALPVVLGRDASGWRPLLGRAELEQAGGSVESFERMLRSAS